MVYCTLLAEPRQLRERLLCLLERELPALDQELELARQRLERQRSGAPSQVSSFSPTMGEFLLIELHPPTNHPAHFCKRSRQGGELVGINSFYRAPARVRPRRGPGQGREGGGGRLRRLQEDPRQEGWQEEVRPGQGQEGLSRRPESVEPHHLSPFQVRKGSVFALP